jgi:hypothetical protein
MILRGNIVLVNLIFFHTNSLVFYLQLIYLTSSRYYAQCINKQNNTNKSQQQNAPNTADYSNILLTQQKKITQSPSYMLCYTQGFCLRVKLIIFY